MIDLKTNHTTVLVGPSGPCEVQFEADFVQCHREYSNLDNLAANVTVAGVTKRLYAISVNRSITVNDSG